MTTTTEDPTTLEKAIKWAQGKGYKEIQATHEDYDTPSTFSRKDNDDITPYIAAKKDGKRSYIELAMKDENERSTVTKWRLLSTMAQMKGGHLVLLAPRGHKSFTDKILEKHPITAKVISF